MGAYPKDPEHFLNWYRKMGGNAGPLDFLPRRLYRDYILALMHESLKVQAGSAAFKQICGEVTDIDVKKGRVAIHLEDMSSFITDKSVLALGYYPPRHPPVKNRPALESARYIRNPWHPGVLDSLSSRDTVFLIGTGQTMIDLVLALYWRAHKGRIIAISRRGLLPMVHGSFVPYESFFREIKESKKILEIFRTVRKHLDGAESKGIDKRAVIDSLRPDTQTIWMGLPEDEKLRFLRHLFRYWEVIRSRIPPESEAIINSMRESGQLNIRAGRICDLVETKTAMEVHYIPRGRTVYEIEITARVINCIGPESDYHRIDSPLLRNLIKRRLIRPGPAHLGIDALPDGAIIGQNGAVSDVLFTLRSTMKGVLWEVLAVPELRVQAENLARILLGSDNEPGYASLITSIRC